MKKLLFTTLMLFCFGLALLYSQETNSTTGRNCTGSGGSVTYTVGQVFYNTISSSNGTIIQGVQQPYEISVATSIGHTEYITLKCIVYPNPTTGYLKLSIESETFENMKFYLYDSKGILLQNKKIEDKETEIFMDSLPTSIYFLKITNNNKDIKTFKIIKN